MPEQRRYTVLEIERMRAAINWRLEVVGGSLGGQRDRMEQVEAHLRTYMLNGTEPLDLETGLMESQEAWLAHQKLWAGRYL